MEWQTTREIAFWTLPDKSKTASTAVRSIIRDRCEEILDCKKQKRDSFEHF